MAGYSSFADRHGSLVRRGVCWCAVAIALLTGPAAGIAQTSPSPANDAKAQAATDAPAEQLEAAVIEVVGKVEYAAEGADPLDKEAWKPVTQDMKLPVSTQVRTGLRSRCVLMFGEAPDQTVISVRRASLASIAEYQRTQDEQRVRLGLGYGAIRGGSSEGTLRSDVVVDSTVATLAKRGTEGFEMEVEPVSGRFRIGLARSGLVEAFAKATRRSKSVKPGEYVTQMGIARMWINQLRFDRAVRFYQVEGLTQADQRFLAREATGLSVVGPAGPRSGFVNLRRPRPQMLDAARRFAERNNLSTILLENISVSRPEGNFGFGRTFRVLTPRPTIAQRSRVAPHRR